MNGELIKLITIIAIPTVTIVASNIALFLHISNKIDSINNNLSERITKLEIETKVEFEKLNSKFDLLEERYNGVKIQTENTDKKIEDTNNRVEKVEYELKESRTENKNLIEKILDILPKSAL